MRIEVVETGCYCTKCTNIVFIIQRIKQINLTQALKQSMISIRGIWRSIDIFALHLFLICFYHTIYAIIVQQVRYLICIIAVGQAINLILQFCQFQTEFFDFKIIVRVSNSVISGKLCIVSLHFYCFGRIYTEIDDLIFNTQAIKVGSLRGCMVELERATVA